MVVFDKRGNVEYVIRKGITVDDPVGAYILKRFEANPKAGTRIGKGGVGASYSDLLDRFEKDEMTREEYESILARIEHTQTPLAVLTKQKEIDRLSDSRLSQLIFGDAGFPKMEVLIQGTPNDIIFDYVASHMEDIPALFDYREQIADAVKAKSLKRLEDVLLRYSNVLEFQMQEKGVIDFMKWFKNRDLRNDFSDAQELGVFAKAKVYAAAERRFNEKR